jgi:biotin carboxyl carrier protein
MEVSELSRILALARAHAVAELEIVHSTGRVRFRRADRTVSVPPAAVRSSTVADPPASTTPVSIAPAGTPHDAEIRLAELFAEGRLHLVRAESVGLFLPLEDADDALAVGAKVTAGTSVGVIKSLGVKRSVIAPVSGIIAAVYARPGEPLQYGHLIVGIDRGPAPGR